ncbi:MAG: Gfo/Idh/MocA family protein [Fimbriimonas sp.]
MSDFRVALVGAGFMGRMHSEVYGALDAVDLVVVCDKDLAKAESLGAPRATADYADVLADPSIDVVDICLPTDLHADFAVRALEAGKHVVCEKPMALRTEDADRMIAAATASGKRLMIAHCIRFWPEYTILEKLVLDGTLGKLLSLNLTRYGAFPTWSSDNWLADESRAGGGALDMHIHDTDYALYLLGKPDRAVSHGSADARGVSHMFTTMTFGETVVQLEGGWNLPSNAPFKMAFRAVFERGAAIWDAGPLTIYEEGKDPVVPEVPKMEATGGGNISDLGGYYFELKYFYDRLKSGEPLDRITPESSRLSLAATLEEIRQVKEGAACR